MEKQVGSTYLQLTNKVLRRLNEVELTDTNFNVARGLQSTVKDAVNDSISAIQTRIPQLNYMAYEHSQDLEQGTTEYAWPDGFTKVDWKSFLVVNDGTLNTSSYFLEYINRDQWYENLKDADEDAGSDGISKPTYVFETHGNGFGVSPSPDEDYLIKFRYWKFPTALSAHGDTTNIDSKFDYVIVAGALFHMYRFRDNDNRLVASQQEFKDGLREMERVLVPKNLYMTDTRVGIKQNAE